MRMPGAAAGIGAADPEAQKNAFDLLVKRIFLCFNLSVFFEKRSGAAAPSGQSKELQSSGNFPVRTSLA